MTGLNGRDLASRVAGLLHGRFNGDLAVAARDLDVDPDELRRIVDERTERPRLDILAKLVQRFGVDACWLVTGDYDWRSHMRLLEDEEFHRRDSARELLQRFTRDEADLQTATGALARQGRA